MICVSLDSSCHNVSGWVRLSHLTGHSSKHDCSASSKKDSIGFQQGVGSLENFYAMFLPSPKLNKCMHHQHSDSFQSGRTRPSLAYSASITAPPYFASSRRIPRITPCDSGWGGLGDDDSHCRIAWHLNRSQPPTPPRAEYSDFFLQPTLNKDFYSKVSSHKLEYLLTAKIQICRYAPS